MATNYEDEYAKEMAARYALASAESVTFIGRVVEALRKAGFEVEVETQPDYKVPSGLRVKKGCFRDDLSFWWERVSRHYDRGLTGNMTVNYRGSYGSEVKSQTWKRGDSGWSRDAADRIAAKFLKAKEREDLQKKIRRARDAREKKTEEVIQEARDRIEESFETDSLDIKAYLQMEAEGVPSKVEVMISVPRMPLEVFLEIAPTLADRGVISWKK